MPNVSFLACTKVDYNIGPASLYCGKWRIHFQVMRDLDLRLTMSNIELVQVIFIYYNIFKYHVSESMSFRVIVQKHKDSDE